MIDDTAERRLLSHGRAVFSRFVSALNRRDSYRLELDDPRGSLTCERQVVLSHRLRGLDREIAERDAELSRIDRRLRGLDR